MVAGAVAEHEQVVREAESVVPVSLGQPVHRDVHAHRIVATHQLEVSATPDQPCRPWSRGRGRRAGSTPGEESRDVRRQFVHDDGRVGRNPSGQCSAPGTPIPSRSNAPSARATLGPRARGRPPVRSDWPLRRSDRATKASSLRLVEPAAADDDRHRSVHDAGSRSDASVRLQVRDLRPQLRDLLAEGTGHVGASRLPVPSDGRPGDRSAPPRPRWRRPAPARGDDPIGRTFVRPRRGATAVSPAFRSDETRRNDATAPLLPTCPSGGGASAGWRSMRGARSASSATAS